MPSYLDVKRLEVLDIIKRPVEVKLPTVAHPGEDAAYDLYAAEDAFIYQDSVVYVHTGITARAYTIDEQTGKRHNLTLLVKDRSSLAKSGLHILGGVIDSGYTGEIGVMFTNVGPKSVIQIHTGDKIAQMVPVPIYTGDVLEVEDLGETARGDKGFGSSGK